MASIEKTVTYSRNSEDLKNALIAIQEKLRKMEIFDECNKDIKKCTEYAYLMRLELVTRNKYDKSFKSRI